MVEQPPPQYAIAETLHEWDGSGVYRAVSADGRHLVLKVLDARRCGRAALDRQRREYEIGRALDLAPVARPIALDTHRGMPALVLEDWGGQPLDRAESLPMDTGRVLEIAVRVVAAVDLTVELPRSGPPGAASSDRGHGA